MCNEVLEECRFVGLLVGLVECKVHVVFFRGFAAVKMDADASPLCTRRYVLLGVVDLVCYDM